jgi:hypothetical protein
MNPEEGLKVNLHQLLRAMIEKGASDMHITSVVGGFSPAPAGVNPAAPHPGLRGILPRTRWSESSGAPPPSLGPRPQTSEMTA